LEEKFKEILSHFDYPNEFLYLRKNRHYSAPFTIKVELKYDILAQWIQETVQLQVPITVDHLDTSRERSATNLKYKFQLPIFFEIAI
jgi:hypothetical protein